MFEGASAQVQSVVRADNIRHPESQLRRSGAVSLRTILGLQDEATPLLVVHKYNFP